MENTIVFGSKRTFRVALFGVAMLIFGGTALAATAPTVAPLKFEYTAKDANGNTITLENKITTGYEANRVAVDSSGNVYVADAVSNTVSVFNTNGRLVRQIDINRPSAIGLDNLNDRIYVSGAYAGTLRSIWTFDRNGNPKGPLSQFSWGNPIDIAVGQSGDAYVADGGLNLIRRLSARGESEKNVYGPFGGEKYAKEQYLKSNVTIDVYRTRHRITDFQGIAVDETRGLLYLSAKEVTEYLDKTCLSTTATVDGTTGSDSACYMDNENSWEYYANLAELISLGKTTDSGYKYWNPVTDVTPISPTQPPVQYHVLVIDINNANNDVNNNGYIEKAELKKVMTVATSNDIYPLLPKGIELDGKGRLYVAAYTSDGSSRDSTFGTFKGGIKVYDVDYDANGLIKGTALTPSGSFAAGVYVDAVYSPNLNADGTPATGGRFFAAAGGVKTVSPYSIDGGINPANTAPGKPVLLEPVSSNNTVAAVNTSTPTLRIRNSTDAENDPLAYSYEVCSGSCTASVPVKVASATGITGGTNNETSMTVSQELVDSLYHWRAQSFDGEKGTWSDEATFCVDEVNSIPTKPQVISPVSGVVSPFGSSLSWGTSTDPDCTNDTLTYEGTVSDSQGNIVKPFSGLGATSISVSEISGLISGNNYSWTVRAADNKGGKSDYSSGSFTYMTTAVKFDSDQPGTKVYIDGNYGYNGKLLNGKYDESGKLVGITSLPIEIQDLTPGSHFVRFINADADYEPFNIIVKIPDPLSVNGKVAVVINGKDTYVNDSKVVASMVKASKIKPSGSGVELVKINGGNATPFVVDYNDDGFKDIIAGGKVNVYNGIGQLIDVIDGKVYLFLAQEQLQADGTKKVILVDSGALQADGSDINVGSNAVPFAADYNNDGKKDLLIGSGNGFIYLYVNSGTDSAPAFTSAGTLKDGSGNDIKVLDSAPVVVDYNNDVRKDLLVGGFDGRIRLYKNTGTDASPEYDPLYETIRADNADLNVGSNSKPFFTDWNSDGKKDLVVGDGSGKVSLFFNVGPDEAPEFKSIAGLQQWIKEKKKERGNRDYSKYLGYNQDLGDLAGGSGEASPFVVDWDGTSARDVIVGNGSGGVSAYTTE